MRPYKLFEASRRYRTRQLVLVGTGVCLLITFTALLTMATLTIVAREAQSSYSISERHTSEQANVYLSYKTIEPGEPLEAASFRREMRPKSSLGPRAIDSIEQIEGKFARTVILPSEPLSLDHLTSIRPSSIITASIPEGFRAVSIRVDATSSVEGWARAGAHVDVVWTSTLRGKQTVTLVAENARILSAERQLDAEAAPGAPVPSTVTLLVPSLEAAKVQLAQNSGTLSLNLRGESDRGKGLQAQSVTVDDLLASKPFDKKVNRGPMVRVKNVSGVYDEFILEDGRLARPDASGPTS